TYRRPPSASRNAYTPGTAGGPAIRAATSCVATASTIATTTVAHVAGRLDDRERIDFARRGTEDASRAARRIWSRDRLLAHLAHRPLQPPLRLLHAARRPRAGALVRVPHRVRDRAGGARGGRGRVPEVQAYGRRADAPSGRRRDRRARGGGAGR